MLHSALTHTDAHRRVLRFLEVYVGTAANNAQSARGYNVYGFHARCQRVALPVLDKSEVSGGVGGGKW